MCVEAPPQDAVKDLPELTDEDFSEIYADLLQYDRAPASPSQLAQLADPLAASNGQKGQQQGQLAGPRGPAALDFDDGQARSLAEQKARRPIKERLRELRARLGRRTKGESDEKVGGPSPSNGTQQPGVVPENYEDNLTRQLRGAQSTTLHSTSNAGILRASDRTASETRRIIAMLEQLLSSSGAPSSASGATLDEHIDTATSWQSDYGRRVNLATSQEWAALALSAAREANADNVFGVLDLMQVCAVHLAQPSGYLCAAWRIPVRCTS